MSSLQGKVAFISGAARGQGRAHAVRLAQAGADIIAFDICQDIESMDYPNASLEDLQETIRLVEKEDRRIIARQADVRNFDAVKSVFDEGFAQFGRIDIVVANAGIIRLSDGGERRQVWQDIIDTNLTGAWNTVEVAMQPMIDGGRGGSIVLTSSTAGMKGTGTMKAGGMAYSAAKRGLVGLMQVLANELGKHSIRVNTIHPTGVASGMTMNAAMQELFESGSAELSSMQNVLPIQMLEPVDIANAVAWLVSDEAHYITGVQLPLDAGFAIR
ncbi:MAG: carveol dehydrogenase ((+)-trans-carveol dehydrogenase) [Acidimicrobiia bacterium]|nr:carveol dehydrogenase ((+)-trans-carveol dehydrogenase) [Acidimicrobiia bacterium]